MIHLQDLSFSYPDGTLALRDVSLRILQGEFILLCGPTGCGKSTLLMTLNGLIPHTVKGLFAGRVTIRGKDTTESSVRELAQYVGTVLQTPEIQIFHVTCTDEIVFGPENLGLPHGEIQSRLEGVLQRLSMDALRNRRTAELSGGEKQKLVVAATLAMEPSVLVLDEPLSDLDPPGKRRIMELLRELHRQGITIILAEHNLELALPYATRVVVMDRGRLVLDGDVHTILRRYSDQMRSMGLGVPTDVGTFPAPFLEAHVVSPAGSGAHLWTLTHAATEEHGVTGSAVMDLVADGLCYAPPYGSEILHEIRFALSGGIAGLVGCNGAGKSMLARILAGLAIPTRGDAFLKGRSVKRLGAKGMSTRCGMLFQNPDLQLICTTVDEELQSTASGLPQGSKRMRALVERLDLGSLLHRHPQGLSRGERQRVALALALLRGRELLLLDEPTNGQDWRHISDLVQLVREAADQGTLVLMITHDIRLVRETAQTLLVLHEGRLLAQGHPQHVLFDPAGLEARISLPGTRPDATAIPPGASETKIVLATDGTPPEMETRVTRRNLLAPTVQQLARMALFLAALAAVEFSIIPFSGASWLWFIVDWYYGGATVAILIACASLTQYPLAVLFLGVCKGLLGILFVSQGGVFMMLYAIAPPLTLQAVLAMSQTFGERLAVDILGGLLYGCTAGFIFFFLVVGVLGMEFPVWFICLRVVSVIVTCGFGGYLGWAVGSRFSGRR